MYQMLTFIVEHPQENKHLVIQLSIPMSIVQSDNACNMRTNARQTIGGLVYT